MLIWERTKNLFESIGYARAANELVRQGHYDAAKTLFIEKSKLSGQKLDAIRRLERVKKAKAEYEPGNHYFRGKSVAFWRGHADA